jgi:hypothetical protein
MYGYPRYGVSRCSRQCWIRSRIDGCMFSDGMSRDGVQAMSVLSESGQEVPAEETCSEAQRKLLPNFAVGVSHHVVRVDIHPR